MSEAFVIGDDPGGNCAHGVAALRVEQRTGKWLPLDLKVATTKFLDEVEERMMDTSRKGRIVAAGVDTLTEWNRGSAGWRPVDLLLRKRYPAVRNSVQPPNALRGSMVVSGAAFLMRLRNYAETVDTMLTEAHPKVCFFAMAGEKIRADLKLQHDAKIEWKGHREEMTQWLIGKLGVGSPEEICIGEDHRFDAATAALAALRGLNGEWTLDLHAMEGEDDANRVRFCGPTYYWWPPAGERTV